MDEVYTVKSQAETARGDSTYSIGELTKKLRIAKESTTNFENKVKQLRQEIEEQKNSSTAEKVKIQIKLEKALED